MLTLASVTVGIIRLILASLQKSSLTVGHIENIIQTFSETLTSTVGRLTCRLWLSYEAD